jgi:hypothetical protein
MLTSYIEELWRKAKLVGSFNLKMLLSDALR